MGLTFWAILNIGLLIFFFYLIIKAIVLLYKKKGIISAFILVLGLLMFSGNNHESKQKKWQFVEQDELLEVKNTSIKHLEIDRKGFTRFNLLVKTGELENKTSIPIEASSDVIGLMGGFDWKPHLITIKKESTEVFNYEVEGILEWSLLGLKIYNQKRQFSGKFQK